MKDLANTVSRQARWRAGIDPRGIARGVKEAGEAREIEYPLILDRYELVDGSERIGRQRAGMGLRRFHRSTEDCLFRVDISHNLPRFRALNDGGDGGHGSPE